jgi:hypothetical protein
MPEICRFYGIVIAMYHNDHGPAHFHAKYAGQTGVFSIEELRLVEGSLPPRVRSLVLEWAHDHREQLLQNWLLAKSRKPLRKIEPLI